MAEHSSEPDPGPSRPTPQAIQTQSSGPTAGTSESADASGSAGTGGDEPARLGGPDVGACTASQLRRFIKSRPYVPLHELRRRFAINGPDDEVTAIDTASGRVFVGLPGREGRLLADLLRQGEIGYELLVDPVSPVVIGVYPMRPVPRP